RAAHRLDHVRCSVPSDSGGGDRRPETSLSQPPVDGSRQKAVDIAYHAVRLVRAGFLLHGDIRRGHLPPTLLGSYSMGLAAQEMVVADRARSRSGFVSNARALLSSAQTYSDGRLSQHSTGSDSDCNFCRDLWAVYGRTLFPGIPLPGTRAQARPLVGGAYHFGCFWPDSWRTTGVFAGLGAGGVPGGAGSYNRAGSHEIRRIKLRRACSLQLHAGSDGHHRQPARVEIAIHCLIFRASLESACVEPLPCVRES